MNPTPLRRLLLIPSLFLASLAPCRAADTYRVVHVYPHDSKAFTQGLVFTDGHLYESTGINGHSTLRRDDLQSGRVLLSAALENKYFGEGLTEWGNTLIQLTWMDHVAFVYDRSTFRLMRTLHYEGEGWGLTHDDKSIILSDGTATLRFLDPDTFHEVGRILVKDNGAPVTELNELEFVHGEIFANIWHSDKIARIAPSTGEVLGWIDLSGLLPDSERVDERAVLNGIAWDAAHDRLFVTGKLWPKLFEIQVVPETVTPFPARGSR
jgi:glutaminyl-peptide cyclotransferase